MKRGTPETRWVLHWYSRYGAEFAALASGRTVGAVRQAGARYGVKSAKRSGLLRKPRTEPQPRSLKPCGTVAAYRRGCRCRPCVDANSRQAMSCQAAMRERGLPPGDPRHGTLNGYANWGCRCEACYRVKSEANAAYQAAHRG